MTDHFPRQLSLTITNACNLRCRMCGQWGENGYILEAGGPGKDELGYAAWEDLCRQAAENGSRNVLLRGGEPFAKPWATDLIRFCLKQGLSVSVDTNGTFLEGIAGDLADAARIGHLHLTVSVDGPEEIHDAVRGVPGTYAKLRGGIAAVKAAAEVAGSEISLSLCFTASPWSLPGLADLPDCARELGVGYVNVVPYYWFPDDVGKAWERQMGELGEGARTWSGFGHSSSGVDPEEFLQRHRLFRKNLGDDIVEFPYLVFEDDGYRAWYADAVTPVMPSEHCNAMDRQLDIQPDGTANFCVDFPDFVLGNARERSLSDIWNGEEARRFREARNRGSFALCERCGARRMGDFSEPPIAAQDAVRPE